MVSNMEGHKMLYRAFVMGTCNEKQKSMFKAMPGIELEKYSELSEWPHYKMLFFFS